MWKVVLSSTLFVALLIGGRYAPNPVINRRLYKDLGASPRASLETSCLCEHGLNSRHA